ncbi:MAG: isoprenylcysteine carboxylmethyltransferase family protein [Anaerolineaceae bacterium]|nr:isoprenylcysteine carboxylmethyltransferase family protein [Anaerolineaceae bacterium]
MNTQRPVETSNEELETSSGVKKRMRQVIVQYLVLAVILFVLSGNLGWVWAWAYLGAGVAIMIVNALIMPRELIAERGQPRENVKEWDKLITTISMIPVIGVPVVCGLDERFGWSPQLAIAVHIAALLIWVLGQGVFSWAMVSNKFFSTAVRIQMDRDHKVATGGPYRYVRHPGYVGFSVTYFATSLTLGSLWALIPAGLILCGLIVRTALEDRTLQEELPGYKEYAQKVRYRLIPGIW